MEIFRYGRRWPLLLAVFVQVLTGVASSFAPDWYTFTIIRFILAISTGGTMITSFVLTMEMVGVKYRQFFSIVYHVSLYFVVVLIYFCGNGKRVSL